MTDKIYVRGSFSSRQTNWRISLQRFHIQPYEFISKNDLSFFQGNVVKYVCRYLNKNGIEDINKIKHYCDLEIEHMKDKKK